MWSQMGSLRSDMSAYVRSRWPLTLLSVLCARPETRGLADLGRRPPVGMDLRGTIDYAEVGRLIAQGDEEFDNARHWERNLRRWFAEERAAEPDQVRRVLAALDANWVVGLGRVGYQQHALCLLHGLWIVGARSLAGLSARAVFRRRAVSDDTEASDRARAAAWLERAASGSTLRLRLDRSLNACWQAGIPLLPRPRADFTESEGLHVAYMALEYALHSKSARLEVRLQNVQDHVAKAVLAWAGPLLKEPARLVRHPGRSK